MFERKLTALEFYSPYNFNYEGKIIFSIIQNTFQLSSFFFPKLRRERISKFHNMVRKPKNSVIQS
jgi:hypothetical protein